MTLPDTRTERAWHTMRATEVQEALATDLDNGLTAHEAHTRQNTHGPNVLAPQRGPGVLKRVWAQLGQPLVVILIVAGIVTAVLEEYVDAAVIFGVVIINALVGYFQEAKAVKAIQALSRTMTAEATVVRDGQRFRVSAAELVPGDVVALQSGDKVPADLFVTYLRDLRVDESALTGESLPVEKQLGPLPADTGLADRTNLVFASSLVTTGQGFGVVVETGENTQVGRISHLIAETHELATPLTRKIAEFSRVLLYAIIALAVATAIVGVIRGQRVVDMFNAAVALAVGAIPEGLPAAVTITLAIGVSRMARRKAIIRKLPAVETLGGTTVICSDKTGTLTENQMTVQRIVAGDEIFTVSGAGYSPEGEIIPTGDVPPPAPIPGAALETVLRAGALCNDSSVYLEDAAWHVSGDPTEAALIVAARKGGLHLEHLQRGFPRLDTLPFESEHRYMATLHRVDEPGCSDSGSQVAYIKGAVEQVLPRCNSLLTSQGSHAPLDAAPVSAAAEAMAAEGLRVLALAAKHLPPHTREITHEHLDADLVLLGLQAMIDPPRAEARDAIHACHTAGIAVKMITGDHALTASAIAAQLGLRGARSQSGEAPARVLTGRELAALDDRELAEAVEDCAVFARVSPEQKLRLVNALQSRRHVVAMTGDGVNDAPALRRADIGVATGITGTEVAKEAADTILTDDNFASIEAAVEEGRGVFDNLTKFIAWTLPTNLAIGLVLLAAIIAGVELPVLPAQALWINMTTGVLLGMTLAFEPKEQGIMLRPPRPPDAPILGPALVGRIGLVGFLLLVGAFGLFELAQAQGLSTAVARTTANNVIVFGQIAYLFNCRSPVRPSWREGLFTNRFLVVGVAAMVGLQLLFTNLPVLNSLFGTAPVPLLYWVWILAAGATVHTAVEIEKAVRRHLQGARGRGRTDLPAPNQRGGSET